MNWLAKINLKVVTQRLGPFKSALYLLLIIIICLFTGYRLGNYYHQHQLSTIKQQQLRLSNLYQAQNTQLARIHNLEVELAVEQLANQEAQAFLKKAEELHYEDKKQLAFYEKIMAPEKQADGLVIDSLKVLATRSPGHYQFQAALVQQKLRRRHSKGHIDLVIAGSLDNKPKQFKLSEISGLTRKELSFNFKYFQIISGDFTLPEDFIAEKVILKATLPKARWQKYYKLEQSFPWLLVDKL